MANGFIMGRRITPPWWGGDGLNWVKVYPVANGASVMSRIVMETHLNTVTISSEAASGYICVLLWLPDTNDIPEMMLFNLSSLAIGQDQTVENRNGEYIRIKRNGKDTYAFYYGGDFVVKYLYYSPITLPE